MIARISFYAEVFVEGDSLAEIKEKFEDMPIFCADALEQYSADFVDYSNISVDDNNGDIHDVTNEFLTL